MSFKASQSVNRTAQERQAIYHMALDLSTIVTHQRLAFVKAENGEIIALDAFDVMCLLKCGGNYEKALVAAKNELSL